jgi:aspartyl/glutamyl-tRNA(Asn/Gln) amidotransferase C subunit
MSENITTKAVLKVANLSRLFTAADEKIVQTYQKQLGSVLNYADELSKLDVTGFSPHQAIATATINNLREDETDYGTEDYLRVRQNILNNFPTRQGDLLQLPIRIVEEN